MHLGLQCVVFFRERPKGLEREEEEEEEKDNDASHCANTFAPVSRFSQNDHFHCSYISKVPYTPTILFRKLPWIFLCHQLPPRQPLEGLV